MTHKLPKPATDRYFEDYQQGEVYDCGSFCLTEQEMIDFAMLYDPQMMHVDRDLAAKGPFGGIIASGWHTISAAMRLLVDNFLPFDGLAAPGIDEVRWHQPIRPNEVLTLTVEIVEARRSRSKPDRGLLSMLMEVRNQNGELALSMKPTNFVRTRNPQA